MDESCREGRQKMTPASDLALAHDWAAILEEREAKRSGLTVEEARPIVARKTGVPTGKLYSLRRKRLKDLARHLLVNLGEGVLRELQLELRHVEHELQTLRQIGADPRSGEVQAVLASRAKIREALGLPASGNGGAT